MRKRIQSIFIISVFIVGLGFVAAGLLKEDKKQQVYYPRYESSEMEQERATAQGRSEIMKRLYGDIKTGEIKFHEINNAYQESLSKRKKSGRSIGMNWQSLGPNNQGGRTRALIIDKDNNELLLTGGVSGGIYRSTNGGTRWTKVSNVSGAVMITSGIQATNGDMYFGTGSTLGEDFPGTGLYKSTDRGLTWNVVASTVPADIINNSQNQAWSYINDLAADPNNGSTIYAATNTGLFFTTDGGATWTKPVFDPPAVNSGDCIDIIFSGDNARLFVGYRSRFVYSDNPTDGSSYKSSSHSSSYIRQKIATSAANPNYVYVATVNGGSFFGVLENIYLSKDKGVTFEVLDPPPPITSANWDLTGEKRDGTLGGGQGWYDWAFTADPADENRFFIGAVQLWRYDGNWTRASAQSQGAFPFYVHADVHEIVWDQNNPSTVYFLSDGGVSKSLDRGVTFFDVNRDYNSTQFYGIAPTPQGFVVGGTQDNGVIGLDPTGSFSAGNPDFGIDIINQGILNGDGFDVEVSSLVDMKFTAAQNGNLGRSQIESNSGAGICGNLCGSGPFWSVHRLWESDNDISSEDSVEFGVDTIRIGVGIGSGAKKTYTGTLIHPQPAAKIVYNTVHFISGSDQIDDFDGDGVLTGAGSGTVNLTTGEFTVNFNNPPAVNSPIYAYFAARYETGDILELRSNTDELPFTYTVTQNLEPGTSIKIQDPVQSLMAFALGSNSLTNGSGGVAIARGVLNASEDVEWLNITANGSGSVPIASGYSGGVPTCFEFTPDGNSLFVGTSNGRVYRVDNLNELYRRKVVTQNGAVEQNRINLITDINQIFSSPLGGVTGMALHPDNPEVILITVGGWNGSSPNNKWVHMIDNAVSATNVATANNISKQGDLPPMPVFDAEFDVRDPSIVMLGTAFGVYSTTNVFANNVEWADENSVFDGTPPPVYDVRQQYLSFDKAVNNEVYYLGTFGNGIWSSSALVGTNELAPLDFNSDFSADLLIYPNPVSLTANLNIDVSANSLANVNVIDISGKVVKQITNRQLAKGQNRIEIPVSELSNGIYFVKASINGNTQVAKFIKN